MRHALVVPLLLLAVACGRPAAEATSTAATGDGAAAVQRVLESGQAAAKRYGQLQLGHYLELDGAALAEHGFAADEDVALDVTTTHDGFCLVATSTALPESDPWHVASVGSRSAISPDDACAR